MVMHYDIRRKEIPVPFRRFDMLSKSASGLSYVRERRLGVTRVLTPSGEWPRGWIAVEGRKIAAMGQGEPPPGTRAVE